MATFYEEVFPALMTLLGVLLTYIIIPYIKSKTTHEQRENFAKWTEYAVWAAEQIAEKQHINKYDYVKNFLVEKFNLTEKEAEVLIESAVKELKIELE